MGGTHVCGWEALARIYAVCLDWFLMLLWPQHGICAQQLNRIFVSQTRLSVYKFSIVKTKCV